MQAVVTIVKEAATDACRYTTFAELTTVVIACRYIKTGRRSDARHLVLSYLKRHGSTPRVVAVLRLAC